MREFCFLIIGVLLYTGGTAGSQAQPGEVSLPVIMGSKQVLIVGESYGHTESSQFFSKTVTEYLNGGGCIKVGLEISSDQQATLESAMKGEIPVSELKINDIIDSSAYRQMLTDLSGQVRAGKCLSVHAIDAPPSVPVTRDAWMEKQVTELTGDTPVLLLVGNVRAVKNTGAGDANGLLAARMTGKMPAVASVLQYWTPGQCENRTAEYISAKDERAGIFLKETVKDVTPVMPENPTEIADGVLVWSCESENVTENMNIDDSGGGESATDQLDVKVQETETIVRDKKVLKRIKWGMKNQYPAIGMTKDEALKAMGDPDSKEDVNGMESWSYQCFDEDGYWHKCFQLFFRDDIVVKFLDLQ